MAAIKPDTRSRESMAAGKGGEWGVKSASVKGRNARKRAAVAEAPKREARPYPSAPVNARPGSNVAVTMMRGYVENIPHLPFRRIGAELEVGRPLTKAEQANHLPFVPEFQAEGQPFPRMARDKDGNVMPRVRTDNGMTKQLQGRGIARREDGKPTYTKRQLEAHEREREAQYTALIDQARYRQIEQDYQDERKQAKGALMDAIGREREALAREDMVAAETAREDIRRFRKAAKFRG